MNKNLLAAGGIALVVALVVSFGLRGTGPAGQAGQNGQPGQNGNDGQNVGSLTGPDIPYTYLNVGGVNHRYVSSPFAATTSVPCILTNTWGATSTILSFTAKLQNVGALASAPVVDVSTSSAAFPYGSSTPALVKTKTWAASSTISWLPGTTTSALLIGMKPLGGDSDLIIAPGESITLRVATGTPGTLSASSLGWTGSCQATFEVN